MEGKDKKKSLVQLEKQLEELTMKNRILELQVRSLKNEKTLAQEYLDIAGVMILAIEQKGKVTLINKKGCEILGFDEEDIVGKNWFDNFLPKETVKDVIKVFKDVFNKREPLQNHFVNHIINSQGEKRLISWYNSLLYDSDRNVVGVLSSGEDITEKNLALEKLRASEERFRILFERAPFGYQSLDDNGCFIDVNEKWLQIFGYKKEEVIGKWFGDFLVEEYKDKFRKRFEKFKKQGAIHSEFPMLTKSGMTIEVAFDGNIAYDADENFIRTHCTVRDTTEINLANERLRKSEQELRELMNLMPLGLVLHEMIFDEKGNPVDYVFLNCNPEYEKQTGLKIEDVIGKRVKDVLPDVEQYWFETFGSVVKNKTPIIYENYAQELKKYFKVTAYPMQGNQFGVIVDDITREKAKQMEIEYLSKHDYLTALYNRRFFVEEYKRMDEPKFYPLGIMMIDVNGLKIINDAFGHDFGDIALKKVAHILKNSLREQDVLARIGGDEFAVILPNITIDELEAIKEKIKEESKKDTIENLTLSLATGYEIQTHEYKGNLDEILKLAENHMYRHKLTEGVSVRNNAIKAILKTLTDKYQEEKIHSLKVSQLCRKMGEALEFKEEDTKELEMAGMYHDIGKISLPDAILYKPGKLTAEEYDTVKTHPEISYQILRAADEYSDLAVHALYHHERWDGKGYPSGKKAEDIPLFSRIICVADAFEAMTAVRPYKDKMTEEDAVKEIIRCSGTQFDPELAKVFVEKVLKKSWKQ